MCNTITMSYLARGYKIVLVDCYIITIICMCLIYLQKCVFVILMWFYYKKTYLNATIWNVLLISETELVLS